MNHWVEKTNSRDEGDEGDEVADLRCGSGSNKQHPLLMVSDITMIISCVKHKARGPNVAHPVMMCGR